MDGGAQDNQARDLEDFARYAPVKSIENPIIVLIADGEYYTKSRARYGNKDFFSYINETYQNQNVFATTTKDFDENYIKFKEELSE